MKTIRLRDVTRVIEVMRDLESLGYELTHDAVGLPKRSYVKQRRGDHRIDVCTFRDVEIFVSTLMSFEESGDDA